MTFLLQWVVAWMTSVEHDSHITYPDMTLRHSQTLSGIIHAPLLTMSLFSHMDRKQVVWYISLFCFLYPKTCESVGMLWLIIHKGMTGAKICVKLSKYCMFKLLWHQKSNLNNTEKYKSITNHFCPNIKRNHFPREFV